MNASAIYFIGGTPYSITELNVLHAKHAQRLANERWGANWPDTSAMSAAEVNAFVKECQKLNRDAAEAVRDELLTQKGTKP